MYSRDEQASAYASSDIFVMPSRTETLGLVVLEAMALGLPVVAARAGGIPELAAAGGLQGIFFGVIELEPLSLDDPALARGRDWKSYSVIPAWP